LSEGNWQLFAGGTVFSAEDPDGKMQVRNVSAIVGHPQFQFNRFLYEQDVALVRLERPLLLDEQLVGAVCLSSKSVEPKQPLCVTAGWGYSSRIPR
jgi:Trypsin